MKNFKILFILVLIIIVSNLSATKYAGEIFQMGAGVRNFALGNCGVSDSESYALAYWNPALLNKVDTNKFEVLHAEEYGGLLTFDTASLIWGEKNKFSLLITRIGIDDIPLTKLQNPEDSIYYNNRPYKYKEVNNSDVVIYFGISRKIGNYQIGFTPKFAYRSLADESGFGFGADISTYFQLSDKWLLAAKIRDFFTTQILWGNGTHEFVNPGIDLETNYQFKLPVYHHQARAFLRTEIFTDGRDYASVTSLGPISMDYHLGLEVDIHPKVDLYLGSDIHNFTSGLTINIMNWNINYALELDTGLENSHRLSLGLKL